MRTGVEKQFSDELTSFFVLILLNIAFGALVMAFGLQVIITSALAVAGGQTSDVLPVIRVAVGVAGVVLGISWLRSSIKIMRGLKGIRREYRNRAVPVSDETVTGWIVEMMAHYRENRSTIRWMTVICSIGGCIYLALGIVNIVQGISTGASPGGMVNAGHLPPRRRDQPDHRDRDPPLLHVVSQIFRIVGPQAGGSVAVRGFPSKCHGAGVTMTGRRSTYEIYWEILVFCKTPKLFTDIINRCDLNSKTGQEYLGFLAGKGTFL
jgi:hypothetical protein